MMIVPTTNTCRLTPLIGAVTKMGVGLFGMTIKAEE